MGRKGKYQDIYRYLKTEIEENRLKANEKLMSEDEMIKQFQCSHMTINKALTALASDGYIKRISGTGTYISDEYLKHINKGLYTQKRLTEIINDSGMIPSTNLISYEIINLKNNTTLANVLGANFDEYIHHFIRTKHGNEQLICITETYLNQKLIPSVDVSKLEGSLNEYLEELNISKVFGSATFNACLANKDQKNIIGTNKEVAILKQTCLWNDSYGNPLELTYNNFIGDFFYLSDDIHNQNNLFKFNKG